MPLDKLSEHIKTTISSIDAHLSLLVPECCGIFHDLYAASRYSLLAPGKRLRPLLAIATAKQLGASEESVLTPACAIELLHTYSLIHDDLPCMDDDDMRRGRPTLHTVYPESYAVLAGDYLLTRAFEILAESPSLNDTQKVQLVAVLAKRSGGEGMIGGQILDIASEGKNIDLHALQAIHLHKTAALITAALEFGGIIARVEEKTMKLLHDVGMCLGLSFQIVDDILNVTSTPEMLGKSAGSDEKKNKATYPSIVGIEASYNILNSLQNRAESLLNQLPGCSSMLHYLAQLVINRKK